MEIKAVRELRKAGKVLRVVALPAWDGTGFGLQVRFKCDISLDEACEDGMLITTARKEYKKYKSLHAVYEDVLSMGFERFEVAVHLDKRFHEEDVSK